MPDSRFDSLSKFLARGTSRRDALRALGGFLGIAALGSAKVAPADAQIACPPPLSSCNGVCVNSTNDPHNCGACNNACPTGTFCAAGTCQCPTGLTLCGTTCRNVQTDTQNCGTCGTVCPQGQVCKSGACQLPAGVTTICNGVPSNIQFDPTNCGACGNRCTPGLQFSGQCCGGVCCPTGTVCLNGACSSVCNGQIVNLQTDSSNCGSCGHACSNGQTCVSGACTGGFSCPATDEASFPLAVHNDTNGVLFCSYPAVPGEDPNDFFCKYSDSTGTLIQDNDAGLCPSVASSSARPFIRPNLPPPAPGSKTRGGH